MILNGRPDTRLSKDSHDRVHAAAEELGYRPNIAARGLRTDKTQTIAFISDHVATTRFASGLIKGALEAAEAGGCVVLVVETGGEPDREAEAIAAVLDRQVDGIIFATMRARELFIPALPAGTNAVMLNATNPHHPTSVLPDEASGGRAAIEVLLNKGHRDGIVLLGHSAEPEKGLFRSDTIAQRIAGIRDAMHEANLSFAAEESVWDWEPEGGFDGTTRLLQRVDHIQAILCLNDRLALGAYQALAEAGIRVPEDVSVVSFDNDDIAAYLRPGLTTVALPHEEMGRSAVRLLLAGGEAGQTLVPMPVIHRNSVQTRIPLTL